MWRMWRMRRAVTVSAAVLGLAACASTGVRPETAQAPQQTAEAPQQTAPQGQAAQPEGPQDGEPVVIARSHRLDSRVLGQTRRLNVYLPPGYTEGTGRLPVLYLLDGGMHEDFHHISGLAQLAAMNGAAGAFLVVGVEGIDRKHDLTAPSKDPRDQKEVPTHGGAAAFRRFLAEEVKPWVEARYRTDGKGVLIGESLAGLFTLETFLREPALFDGYVAISPSLWWDTGSLAKEAPALLKAHPAGKRALYLSIGDEGGGMRTGVEAVVAALKAGAPQGLTWHYEPLPGEHHHTVYHPAAWRAVRTLFPPPPPPPRPASTSPYP
jgi:predicted alpha/beta superfamily hydrolase